MKPESGLPPSLLKTEWPRLQLPPTLHPFVPEVGVQLSVPAEAVVTEKKNGATLKDNASETATPKVHRIRLLDFVTDLLPRVS
jgi:hypothetical protein